MSELVFEAPFEIPVAGKAVIPLKQYIEALQIGPFGAEGQGVGLGYTWYTHTGIGNGGLAAVCTLAKRLQRALISTLVLSRRAETYNLEQRIIYIRDGDPYAVITIRED